MLKNWENIAILGQNVLRVRGTSFQRKRLMPRLAIFAFADSAKWNQLEIPQRS